MHALPSTIPQYIAVHYLYCFPLGSNLTCKPEKPGRCFCWCKYNVITDYWDNGLELWIQAIMKAVSLAKSFLFVLPVEWSRNWLLKLRIQSSMSHCLATCIHIILYSTVIVGTVVSFRECVYQYIAVESEQSPNPFAVIPEQASNQVMNALYRVVL